MAKFPFLISALVVMFSPLLFIRGVEPTTFTVVNKCDYTVWPGILANAGKPAVSTTSFALQKGEFRAISPRTNAGRPSEAETRRGRGRERTEKECEQNFLEAGFRRYKIRPTFGLRSLIEVYP
ncbi:hypothetical protein CDL15_Pgr000113 [Punica granatum]|uniref:Uncharacterized protein n=1 Tax=Punica granatum TaxID=22663 RepID=A0A218Y243_PUNGR|nr:hypothetical protein CDL15_Pgr000113 [Punica granatum]